MAIKAHSPTAKGLRTRSEILATAVDASSAEGLEGLSIGRLAELTHMSKSGLIQHFTSKERLQLAVVDCAVASFHIRVTEPSAKAEIGMLRLKSMLKHWIRFVEHSEYRGGCFWYNVSAEFDDRPGQVRDRIAEFTGTWFESLRHQTAIAIAKRQIDARGRTAEDIAFAIHAAVQNAISMQRLLGSPQAFTLARRSVESLIGPLG